MIGFSRFLAVSAAAVASHTLFAVSFDFVVPDDLQVPKILQRGKPQGIGTINAENPGIPPVVFGGGGRRPPARPASLVDTLSLNPKGEHPATGWDSIPSDPGRSGGYDVALGFAFQTSISVQISAVEFLMRQTEPGGGLVALLYQGQGTGSSSAFKYWQPAFAAKPLATFLLDSPPPPSDTSWATVRFKLDVPYTLALNTPYVIVLDPLADPRTGKGQYGLAKIPKDEGYLSATGTPDVNVIMPSTTIRRLQYEQVVGGTKVTKSLWMQQDANYRYVVSGIVPEPCLSAVVGGIVALCWAVFRRRRLVQ